jgi:drug/metabolite transporter (DMT)-like permease
MTDNQPSTTSSRIKAIFLALLVTLLWSTSWVLIKLGLKDDLPAITTAGLRYTIAFLCLLPFVLLDPKQRVKLRAISRRTWLSLAILGLVYYFITQGTQYLGLAFLPAATLGLLLNLTPIFVAIISSLAHKEPPTGIQWGGIGLAAIGALIYFLPVKLPAAQVIGLIIGLVCLLANSWSAILGRNVNRDSGLSPLVVTTISMGIGGVILLAVGGVTQGFGNLDPKQWMVIAWMAVINTAIAFTLWNRTLKSLTAIESSVINGTMMPQIAILAWLFLQEPLSTRQIIGIVIVGVGSMVTQIRRLPHRSGTPEDVTGINQEI